MKNITKGKWHAVNYAGFWNIQTCPDYSETDLLDENLCKEAKKNAEFIVFAGNLAQKYNIEAFEDLLNALYYARSLTGGNNGLKKRDVYKKVNEAIKKAIL